jgi:hypothetical protein
MVAVAEWVSIGSLPVYDRETALLRPVSQLRVPVPPLCGEGRGLHEGTWSWSFQAPIPDQGPEEVIARLEAEAARAGYTVEPTATQPPDGTALRLVSAADEFVAIVAVRLPFTILHLNARRPSAT